MSEENKTGQLNSKGKKDTNLLDLIILAWTERFLIIIVTAVFIVLGLFVAFGSTEEFSSHVKLLPEDQQVNRLGALGGFARQLGISGRQELQEGIPPTIYPEIGRSLVLMMRLMEHEVRLPENDTKVSLFEYFNEHQKTSPVDFVNKYTVGLPFTVLGWVRGWFTSETEQIISIPSDDPKAARILRLTRDQWEVIEILRERVFIQLDQDNGIVTVAVRMPNAVIAADVADQVVQYLIEYIMDYRTEKARSDLVFIKDRYDEIKDRFEEAQVTLAEFTDRQRSTTRATDEIQIQRLQSEFNLTFSLYTSMAERLEQARIKLQEDTPIVMILEPAAVPERRSRPNRPLTLVIFTLLGLLLSVGYAWTKPVAIKLKEELANSDKGN